MTGAGTNPALIIPAMHAFASAQAAPVARCVVELGWDAQTAAEQRELIRHEALINLAFTEMPVTVLRPYDATRLEPGILAYAERTHPALIRDGETGPSSAYRAAAGLPAECDGPLDQPPPDAARLAYRAELAAVRTFATGRAYRPADLDGDHSPGPQTGQRPALRRTVEARGFRDRPRSGNRDPGPDLRGVGIVPLHGARTVGTEISHDQD